MLRCALFCVLVLGCSQVSRAQNTTFQDFISALVETYFEVNNARWNGINVPGRSHAPYYKTDPFSTQDNFRDAGIRDRNASRRSLWEFSAYGAPTALQPQQHQFGIDGKFHYGLITFNGALRSWNTESLKGSANEWRVGLDYRAMHVSRLEVLLGFNVHSLDLPQSQVVVPSLGAATEWFIMKPLSLRAEYNVFLMANDSGVYSQIQARAHFGSAFISFGTQRLDYNNQNQSYPFGGFRLSIGKYF